MINNGLIVIKANFPLLIHKTISITKNTIVTKNNMMNNVSTISTITSTISGVTNILAAINNAANTPREIYILIIAN